MADWAVEAVEEEHRHFRVMQTVSNSHGAHYLCCAGIELCGGLREAGCGGFNCV